MRHSRFWARFFLVAALATAVMIFWFSAQKGADSQALSDQITLQVAQVIRPDLMEMPRQARTSYLETLGVVIRKNAHFCEFMLLGFNLMGLMHFGSPELSGRGCRVRAWGIATLYAVTDELHQLFVNQRSAQPLDVLIDSTGSLAGTLVMTLALALLARYLQKRSPAR